MVNFVVFNILKNKEKLVEFLGLFNSDLELLNGFVWGIEGEVWEKVDGLEDKIKLLDGYQLNIYMFVWNIGNNKILYI